MSFSKKPAPRWSIPCRECGFNYVRALGVFHPDAGLTSRTLRLDLGIRIQPTPPLSEKRIVKEHFLKLHKFKPLFRRALMLAVLFPPLVAVTKYEASPRKVIPVVAKPRPAVKVVAPVHKVTPLKK